MNDDDEDIENIVEDAPDFAPEPPRPLMRSLPPATPYPLDALGNLLAGAAKAIHDNTQAPEAICGQSVLAAAALAVQAHANVELPTGSTRPLSCFFLSIAASGERKSACDTLALDPIRVRESNLREQHSADSLDYQNKKDVWEQSRKKILKGTTNGKIEKVPESGDK